MEMTEAASHWEAGCEMGVVIPPLVGVVDLDCGGDSHRWIDAVRQREVFHALLPILAEASLPAEITPSGGRHYFGRIPAGWRGRKNLDGAGVEMLVGPHFLKTWPSPGYFTLEETWPVPVTELPEFPAGLLALFAQKEKNPETRRAGRELRELLTLAPGLRRRASGRYSGLCPFHEDAQPSFGLLLSARGRWRWRCFAGCAGSAVLRSGEVYHGGDLRDLRTLLRRLEAQKRKREGATYAEAEAVLRRELPADSPGLRLGLAILAIAQRRGLNLQESIRASYREIAAEDSCIDQVMPNNALLQKGRRIMKARRELEAIGVEVGEAPPAPPYRRGTTLWDFSTLRGWDI
jgi:hypothetical protein